MQSDSEIAPSCGIRLRDDVQLQTVDEQLVLLNLETAEFFGLDEIAKCV